MIPFRILFIISISYDNIIYIIVIYNSCVILLCREMEEVKFMANDTDISINQFSPKVLMSSLFTQGLNFQEGFKLKERYVYDYELEFFVFSKGSMIIDNNYFSISKGDVVFRKPGQYTQGIMPYSCYLICFDLLGNTNKDPETYDFTKEQEFQCNYTNTILDEIPSVFKPSNYMKYLDLFDLVLKEFINPKEYSGILLKSSVLRIIYEISSDIKNPFVNNESVNSAHYMAVKKVMEYIEVNLKGKITLEKLASVANLSPTYFHKVFTDTLGITPTDYIIKVRLDKAKELLVKTNMPVYEVALECGYENIPYFSYAFKSRLNIAPVEFRKRHSYFI